MQDAIITLYPAMNDGRSEEILIRFDEEGFLINPDGEMLSLLPGLRRVDPGYRALAVRRGAEYGGVAGAQAGDRRGWFSFRGALLSPRRFVVRHGQALLGGASAGAVLTRLCQEALAQALASDGEMSKARMWARCRRRVEAALMDSGWQLTGFMPGRIDPGREASA